MATAHIQYTGWERSLLVDNASGVHPAKAAWGTRFEVARSEADLQLKC